MTPTFDPSTLVADFYEVKTSLVYRAIPMIARDANYKVKPCLKGSVKQKENY